MIEEDPPLLASIAAGEIDADPHVFFRLRNTDLSPRFGKTTVRKIKQPFIIVFATEIKAALAWRKIGW
ncbi:MAG: hypothetical protein FWG27_07115 [Treponema sp.]|nr:hypothetical protein [Treponema sp.]